tara:strand:- start:88 stop:570 length:483 start_codon:yes stop_codon:yes gene_type:complete
VLRGSLLPEIPRIIIVISKRNMTHDMIYNSGIFAVHLLKTNQMNLVWDLGFFSGRTKNKLHNIEYEFKESGSPILKNAYAYLDCKVVNCMDVGDSTCFLGTILKAEIISEGEILTSEYFRKHMPAKWSDKYQEQLKEAQEFAQKYGYKITYKQWKNELDS